MPVGQGPGSPGGTPRWDPPVGPAVARHRADRPNREPAPAAHRRSHPWFLPVKTEPANDSGARPHPGRTQNPAHRGVPFSHPERRRRPGVRRLFPRYNPSRSPGRGSVWQSTWFGIRGSQVQILPPRRGPPDAARPTRPARRGPPDAARPTRPARRGPSDAARPPDGFPQTGSGRQVPADRFRQTGSGRRVPAPRRPRRPAVSDAFSPALSHPGKGRSFRHSPMVQNVYISALLPETVRPGGCPFSCSCFLTFPNRV